MICINKLSTLIALPIAIVLQVHIIVIGEEHFLNVFFFQKMNENFVRVQKR